MKNSLAAFWRPPSGGARGQLPPPCPPRYATASVTVQARVQEFVRGGGGQNLKAFFLLFNFLGGGGPAQKIDEKMILPPPPRWTRACGLSICLSVRPSVYIVCGNNFFLRNLISNRPINLNIGLNVR